VAPNGRIYCIPASRSAWLEINPATITTASNTTGNVEIGSLTTNALKWLGGVIFPTGTTGLDWQILGVPRTAGNDHGNFARLTSPTPTSARVNASISWPGAPNNGRWASGCLAPNGLIYMAPRYRAHALEVNPTSGLPVREIGDFATNHTTRRHFSGTVLAPNGNIYFIPATNAAVACLTPDRALTNFPRATLLSAYLNTY
jgi:hypothetical protein